jgi:hypothetical protein
MGAKQGAFLWPDRPQGPMPTCLSRRECRRAHAGSAPHKEKRVRSRAPVLRLRDCWLKAAGTASSVRTRRRSPSE